MFANYFLVGLVMGVGVGVVVGMPSSSTNRKSLSVESTTVKILMPPSSSFDEDDDAVIIDADATTPPVDLTPSTFNSTTDCFLPAEKGPCKAIIESWTYSPTTSACITFQWGGCAGNLNRFSERKYCDQHCTNVLATATATNNGSSNSSRSSMKKAATCPVFEGCGPLKCASSTDPITGCQKCECNSGAGNEPVILGSVSGNPEDPNQQAHVKAEAEKKPASKPEDVCHLPETRGNCRAMMTRWRYSPELKECVQFHYGGCDSQAFPNNFHTLEKCMEFCRGQ